MRIVSILGATVPNSQHRAIYTRRRMTAMVVTVLVMVVWVAVVVMMIMAAVIMIRW